MKKNLFFKILVNVITTSRLLFSFFLLPLIPKLDKYIFLFIIIFLFLTDFIDGIIARTFQVQTLYGSTMDTIADKALSIILIIPLLNIKSIWLILLGEITISAINTWGRLKRKSTKSSLSGKIKMWFLAITIILGYLHYYQVINLQLVIPFSIITNIIQLYVIIYYIQYLKKQQQTQKSMPKNKQNLWHVLFNTEYYLKHN